MKTELKLENKLSPILIVGVNFFKNIVLTDRKELNDFINFEPKKIKSEFLQNLPEGYQYSRKLYKEFKIDPTKHRPSSEALWRRIKKGLEFPRVNPIVDLTNLLSLKYQISYGLYDKDKIKGEIIIILGSEKDKYQGIRKNILNFKGKIIATDDLGAFGNPSADSLRTSVNDNSKNILQIIFFHKDYPLKDKVLEESYKTYKKFFNFEYSYFYC